MPTDIEKHLNLFLGVNKQEIPMIFLLPVLAGLGLLACDDDKPIKEQEYENTILHIAKMQNTSVGLFSAAHISL